jgi:hypothetical protein
MIRFFIWLLLTLIIVKFYKKYKYNWYFRIDEYDELKDLVLINFLYYDKQNNIKKGRIIVGTESGLEIKSLLEELFLEKISI